MENKVVKVSFENTNMIVEVDPNRDNQIALTVKIDIAEFADEIASALFKKKPVEEETK